MFIAPAVAGNAVYIGSCSGTFFAFDRATGEVLWRYDTAQDGSPAQFHGDALVTDELVVVGTDAQPSGHLYAFERGDGDGGTGGAVRWKHAFPHGVSVDLHRHGSNVLAVSMTGDVMAIDLAGGEVIWAESFEPPSGGSPSRGGSVDPALADGRYYVPWRSGHLDAYDAATGELLWRRELPAPPNSSVVMVDGALVLGTIDGRLLRLDAASGEPAGELALGSVVYGELVPAGDCLLALVAPDAGVEAPGHAVACVAPDLSRVGWRHATEATELGTFEPLVVGDEVVFGFEGELRALALEDGAVRWSHPVRGLPRGLAATGSTLYVGTLGGTVMALPWARDPGYHGSQGDRP